MPSRRGRFCPLHVASHDHRAGTRPSHLQGARQAPEARSDTREPLVQGRQPPHAHDDHDYDYYHVEHNAYDHDNDDRPTQNDHDDHDDRPTTRSALPFSSSVLAMAVWRTARTGTPQREENGAKGARKPNLVNR